MIRLALTLDGTPTVVLGLEPVNMARLARGEPIKVNLRMLDPDGPPTSLPDVDLYVAATATDDWQAFIERLPGGGPVTWYLATCQSCTPRLPQPFSDPVRRDEWTRAHAAATGHTVLTSEEQR